MIQLSTRTMYPVRLLAATVVFAAAAAVHGQAPASKPAYPLAAGGFGTPPPLQLPSLPTATPITANGAVVADVIARVNDEIITRSEYEHAEQQMLGEAQQQNESEADLRDRIHNLLRDLIDQQILLSKGKELGITGDADLIRQLDEIRKQNHFDSLEALQKAAEQQGVSFEDFKQHVREQAITQQVVRDEVGRRINMTHGQEEAYYKAHAKDFEVPEQVHLSEILVSTPENATDAQIAAAQAKADEVDTKLKGGANFADLAKSSSGGPTASAGGDLGDFKRGMLGDVLEKATFPLAAGGFTTPIRTRQGFVLLRVDSHQAAGTPPLEDVESQVQEAIYLDQLQPALRAYLTKAREDAYLDIKPGFIDTGSASTSAKPSFTAYAPPPVKKKTLNHEKEEQEKAAIAQSQLAAARERVAERNAEKAAAQAAAQASKGGVKNVSKASKPVKVHREKIRYGQAPQNALPNAPVAITEGTTLGGQAPGTAMAMTETTTTISTGNDGSVADPFAPQAAPAHKTRYAQHQADAPSEQLEKKAARTEEKASIRPLAADSGASATEKQQAAPLGLNGDTSKKKKQKDPDAPKSRMQDQPSAKPAVAPAEPVAPTVNPALVASPTGPAPATKSSDTTTLPPADTPAPGAMPQGQPIPATTSAEPNQPATTPVPH